MINSFIMGDSKHHLILGTVTEVNLLCGSCGKSWTERSGSHRPTCPHCKTHLPAWGLPQNTSIVDDFIDSVEAAMPHLPCP